MAGGTSIPDNDQTGIDWPAVAGLLASVPLPASLAGLASLTAPHLDGIDLWLLDYQEVTVCSMTTAAEERPLTVASWADDPHSGSVVAELRVYGDRLGFVSAGTGPDREASERAVRHLAPLLAAAVTATDKVGDVVAVTRRRRSLSLAAELQWSVLPPTRFESAACLVSAAVEPAYETGGDVFDYAHRDGHLIMSVLDAMGHGYRAATASVAAIGALRRARRDGADLEQLAAEIHAAVAAIEPATFVTAVLVDLDLATGTATYLSAGHVAPLVISPSGVRAAAITPTLPLGLVVGPATPQPVVHELVLEGGDQLVLYSDGVVENVDSTTGRPVGDQLLADMLGTLAQAPSRPVHPARDVIQRLMAVTGSELRDDATLLIASYR